MKMADSETWKDVRWSETNWLTCTKIVVSVWLMELNANQ